MRARIGLLGTLLTLPLLAGCLDLSQDLTITSAGKATLVSELTMATETAQMAESQGGDSSEFCPEEDASSGLPESFETEVEVFTEGDNTICRMTATGPIADLADALASGELMPSNDETAPTITLVDEGNGVYLYTVSITIPDNEPVGAEISEEEQAMNDQMTAMMRTMFEGHTVSWSITAPRIIETDGERDGNTVSYSIPLTAMVDSIGETFGFMVRFGL